MYVCFVYDEILHDELAIALLVDTNIWSQTFRLGVFQDIKTYIKKYKIPLINVIGFATDSAPSAIDSYHGFIVLSKAANHYMLLIHCAIYWRYLVAKSKSACLNLNVVNKFKANLLSTHLFKQLCNENKTAIEHLLLYSTQK